VLIGVPGQLTRPVFDLRIGDGAVGDRPARLCPGSVGARGDLAALPAQDSADQLDRVAFGTHLIDEHGDQRLRGSVKSARSVRCQLGGWSVSTGGFPNPAFTFQCTGLSTSPRRAV
jgi:hypothetical protein